MTKLRIIIAPASAEQARIADQAYRSYGIGTGHLAGRNVDDCFADALIQGTGRPPLFDRDDFTHIEIAAAA